jgi:hypothetical protein
MTCRSHFPCPGIGSCRRRCSSPLTSWSFAPRPSRRDFRLSRNLPRRVWAADKGEAQKVESLRFAEASPDAVLRRVAPELDEPGLLRVKRLTPVHRRLRLLAFPARTGAAPAARRSATTPRFQRDPFRRDAVFHSGRATAPRIPVPHMLPSTLLTVSASASSEFRSSITHPTESLYTLRSRVYASQPLSPTTTQHSLPGARCALPGPVFHRLDRASFPGAQAIRTRGNLNGPRLLLALGS